MQKLFGTVVPIITPLTEDDKIDVQSLKNLVDHCINNGLQCLYPCGTTGEMMYLTVEERKLVTETVVKHTNKRVPVFAQVGAWNLADTIELARHAVEVGADGIGVVTPVFYKLSDQGLVDFYEAVAKSVPADFPVYLYSIPQNAVNDINPATAAEHGIAQDDWVWIETYVDKIRQRAKITPTIKQGICHAMHGWWYPEEDGNVPNLYGNWKSNVNMLMPNSVNGKLGFGNTFKQMMVKLKKADGEHLMGSRQTS